MGEIVDALKKAQQDPPKESAPDQTTLTRQRPAPVVAHSVTISRKVDENQNAREVLLNPGSAASEAYRKLALKVRAEMRRRGVRSLAVTGPLREEGKTTTSCNLALALASMAGDQRIALVCLDLRRPNVARSLGVTAQTSLDEVLRGEASVQDCRHRTEIEGLDLYLSSHPSEDSHSILSGPAFPALLTSLEAQYDFVVVDTPPVLLVPDTVIIAEHTGGWLAVVRRGKTRMKRVAAAFDALPQKTCLGIVLNEAQSVRDKSDYGYYYLERSEAER